MNQFQFYLKRLKHLPGQHDQRAHGSGGGNGDGGGGGASALQSLQDEYTRVSDALRNGVDGKRFSEYDYSENSAFSYVARYNVESMRTLSNLDIDTQSDILDTIGAGAITNPAHIQAAMHLSLFGGSPELRMRAGNMLNAVDAQAYADMYTVSYGGGYGQPKTTTIKPTQNASAREFFEMNSIDHMLATDPDGFALSMWKIHTDGNVSMQSVALSGMAQIVAQVGPNAGYTPEHSFYPTGVRAPQFDSRAVSLMQAHYERTQQALTDAGIRSVQLYRGGPLQPGISVEPWSTSVREASDWAMRGKTATGVYQRRAATIPKEFILNWFQNPNESVSVDGGFGPRLESRIYSEREQEYTIAGLGYKNSDSYASEQVIIQ